MFKVVGNHAVGGVEPGGVVSVDAVGESNVAMLIEAGHIVPVMKKAVKAASAQADEADQSEED